jgi:3D (Asp-Asp-Asp) domain-containing protein
MRISFKCPVWGKSLLIFTLGFSSLLLTFKYSGVDAQEVVPVSKGSDRVEVYDQIANLVFCGTMISQANFLEIRTDPNICSKANPVEENRSVRRIRVVLTAYSSTVAQTDSTPFITANGTYVHDGVVANNGLPFGTELRIPELYGNKVFSVEDRMHWRKGNYHFDIWFPTYEQAKNFGVRYAYVEILKK